MSTAHVQQVPSSLDPHESIPHLEGPPSCRFRHSGWSSRRRRLFLSLQRRQVSQRRIDRFASCGRHAWVQRDADDHTNVRVAAETCRDRHCLPCQQERSRIIARNLVDQLPPSSLRFLTLTLRSTDAPLAQQLDRLYKAFRSLRRAKAFVTCVSGGVAFLELTWNDRRSQWHPHLHCIITGRYIPHATVSALWHERTRDSHIVDIRAVNSTDDVASYVCKYVSKTAVPDCHLPDDRLDEWCHATEHRKLCICWGSFRGFRLLHRQPSETSWEPLCSLDKCIQDAIAGDPRAVALLERLSPIGLDHVLLECSRCLESQ